MRSISHRAYFPLDKSCINCCTLQCERTSTSCNRTQHTYKKKQHVENRWDCESLGPAVTVAANGQLAFFIVVVFAGIVNAVTETSY